MTERAPPFVHLALAAVAALVLIIGGTVTFGQWGELSVRLVALVALAAVVVHAASTYLPKGHLAVRAVAWAVLIVGASLTGVLNRPEVLVPLVGVALVDLAMARVRTRTTLATAGRVGKGIAGLWSLATIVMMGVLILFGTGPEVVFRLGLTTLVAWALITSFALLPDTRTAPLLLAGAATIAVTFLLLASPLMPFGPLISYWGTIVAVALAILVAAVQATGRVVEPQRAVHVQRVHPMPDPIIAPLTEDMRRFIENGSGGRDLSRRIEHALGRDEDGRLLLAMCEATSRGTQPSRDDRRRALRELLLNEDTPPIEGAP